MTDKEFVLTTMREYGLRRAQDLQKTSEGMTGTELYEKEDYIPDFSAAVAKIDDYERYCEEHPEYPNNRAVLAIENIREVYKERLKKRDFLQESQPRMDEDFPRS